MCLCTAVALSQIVVSKCDLQEGKYYIAVQVDSIATVGDVDTWTDTAAGEQDRTYWLKSINEHGVSGFSEPAYGRTSPWQIQLIDPDGRFIVLSLAEGTEAADLWVSCRSATGWEQPVRLPPPINSPFAEFAPALDPSDGALLFTSERPGILGPVPDSVRPPGDIWRVGGGYRIDLCDA